MIPLLASIVGLAMWSPRIYRFLLASQTPSFPLVHKITFIVTAIASTIVAELVLCQILNRLSTYTRGIAWTLVTPTLVIMLVLVIPGFEIWALVSSSKVAKSIQPYVAGVIFVFHLIAFVQLGRYLPLDTKSSTVSGLGPQALSRLGFLGITAMAMLSGFCSVSAPYTIFFIREKPVNEQTIERLSRSVETTGQLIDDKRREIQQIRNQIRERTKMSTTSLMFKVMASLRSDNLSSDLKSLELELNALTNIKSDLDRDLQNARTKLVRQVQDTTPIGRLYRRMDQGFAVYCMYRVFNILVFRNPWICRGSSKSDPVVLSLAGLAHTLYPALDLDAWARQMGFTISGLLFVASISSVATTYRTLSKAMPWLKQRSSLGLTPLVVAQVAGTYVVSTSLVLRSNLPKDMSSAVSSAMGSPLDVTFVEIWFDSIFVFVALASVFGLWVAGRLRETFDEEVEVGKVD